MPQFPRQIGREGLAEILNLSHSLDEPEDGPGTGLGLAGGAETLAGLGAFQMADANPG